MLNDAQTLPDDPSRLKDMVAEGLRECGVPMGELKSRDILIEKLRHQLAGMRQYRFGSRSEALDQLALSLEDEAIATSARDDANAVEADQATPSKSRSVAGRRMGRRGSGSTNQDRSSTIWKHGCMPG